MSLLDGELRELIARRERAKVVKGSQIVALVFHRNGKPIQQSWFRPVWVAAALAARQGKLVCSVCGSESAQRVWHRCCHKRVEYCGKLVHDLRRSAARDMIRAGVPQTVAMRITGHKTETMFRRYNICDTDDLRAALSKTALYREAGRNKVRVMKHKLTSARDQQLENKPYSHACARWRDLRVMDGNYKIHYTLFSTFVSA